MGDDAFDDVGGCAQLAGALVEMFAAGRTAIEHFRRGNVVDSPAQVADRVGVKVSERGIFLAGLMIGQGIIHDCVLGDFRERNVLCHVIQIGPVILPEDEKLPAVAEHSGANSGLFESCVLLDNGDVPTIELAELGIRFLNDFLASGNVEKPGHLLINIPFPQCPRQAHDVFARVVGNQETGGRLQFTCRFRNIAQLKVSDFSGEGEITGAVE